MGEAPAAGDAEAMTATTFLIGFVAASGLLALWFLRRLPGFAPAGATGALAHIGASAVMIPLGVAPGIALGLESGSTAGLLLGVLAVALPPLTYAFLAALWAIRVAQSAMPGR